MANPLPDYCQQTIDAFTQGGDMSQQLHAISARPLAERVKIFRALYIFGRLSHWELMLRAMGDSREIVTEDIMIDCIRRYPLAAGFLGAHYHKDPSAPLLRVCVEANQVDLFRQWSNADAATFQHWHQWYKIAKRSHFTTIKEICSEQIRLISESLVAVPPALTF